MERPMRFEEVRSFMGVGHDFLYKELQSGRLIGSKIGNRWIIYPKDLNKYLTSRPNNRKRIRKGSIS